ncbi:L,D-transpeptidase family protein [Clostridium sp. D53t1_180928_C8]|uniref:L,D-transpeptidase family protein n=1 Tax=Clostridium sp. D53t1_180928_C8 TaxID=2787101 RepID=UPI0018ABD23A|nr:L,D-transpeptidase family protein [Clostridium sp. D53t1_180928_C8]
MNNLFRKPKRSIFKIITIIFAGLLLVLAANYYINYKYSSITESFFSKFNNCDFTAAKQTISEDNLYLKLKKKTLNKDLNTYFSSVVKDICNSVLDNEDDKSKALLVLNEIKSYNVLNSSLNKVIISLDDTYIPESDSDYKAILDLGLDNCNSGNFTAAIDFLNKIPDSSKYYSDATKYIDKCINDYKDGLFKEADALVKDDYYTKAINLLSNVDTSIISQDDADITSKISSIAEAKENYLASIGSNDAQNLTLTSSQLLQAITSSNINTLNIESLTPYLVYVNLADQITYVYKGSMNKWDTVKSFTCSTGIDTEKTPTGIFDVRERGDWFYSDKYEQGGKYWVQFSGDYLFHSVPYNEDQSEVVDNTLGTPASHGCIRLKTEDAKWIYNNIESGTKVIIN